MPNPPNNRCRDCLWSHSGPIQCLDCPHYPESDRWILPCSQCKEFVFVSRLYEIVFDMKGLFLFCSKECKERWDFDAEPDKDLSKLEWTLK
jgi:hypothetical protein